MLLKRGKWRIKNLIKTPVVNAVFEYMLRGAKNIAPSFHCVRLALIGYVSAAAGVIVLLLARGPLTVSRLIISVIADAVNGASTFWSRPHIFKEIGERVLPSITNSYTSTSIKLISFVFNSIAPRFHALPVLIFGSFISAVLGYLINPRAPTARGKASGQVTSKNFRRFPALTLTKPFTSSFSGSCYIFDGGKLTKSFPGYIFECCHNFYSYIGGVQIMTAKPSKYKGVSSFE